MNPTVPTEVRVQRGRGNVSATELADERRIQIEASQVVGKIQAPALSQHPHGGSQQLGMIPLHIEAAGHGTGVGE
jgi:hypothetical protein